MADILDPEDRAAEFARTFRNTTDLDQRRRFAQDISEAAIRHEERKARAFEEAQQRDPALMNAVTNRMQEGRMIREGAQKQRLAESRLDFQTNRQATIDSINSRKIALSEMQEERMLRKADRELKDAERIEFDTDAFERGESELRDMGFMPGSSQYRDGIGNLIARHPYATEVFREVAKGAKVVLDPDELQSRIAEFRANNPDTAFTVAPDGAITARATQTKPTPSAKVDLARLDKLTKEEAELAFKDKKTPAIEKRLAYLRGEIAEIDSQRVAAKGGQSNQSVAQTPTQKATLPAAVMTIDIARQFLKESGGDKDKARALAKEKGYQW